MNVPATIVKLVISLTNWIMHSTNWEKTNVPSEHFPLEIRFVMGLLGTSLTSNGAETMYVISFHYIQTLMCVLTQTTVLSKVRPVKILPSNCRL